MKRGFSESKYEAVELFHPQRAFADHVVEYIVSASDDPSEVLAYCRTFLYPCKYAVSDAERTDKDPYYKFSAVGRNRYSYVVIEPMLVY